MHTPPESQRTLRLIALTSAFAAFNRSRTVRVGSRDSKVRPLFKWSDLERSMETLSPGA
jgi:hypothetical protein